MCLLLLLCAMPCRADCVRLHVSAASDGQEDQEKKLLARDAVMDMARETVKGCGTAEEALQALAARADSLSLLAGEAAGQRARWEAGVFSFPETEYGDGVLPEGEYMALRILLDGGKGHNWWCMLYPDLYPPIGENGDGIFRRLAAFWLLWRG